MPDIFLCNKYVQASFLFFRNVSERKDPYLWRKEVSSETVSSLYFVYLTLQKKPVFIYLKIRSKKSWLGAKGHFMIFLSIHPLYVFGNLKQ